MNLEMDITILKEDCYIGIRARFLSFGKDDKCGICHARNNNVFNLVGRDSCPKIEASPIYMIHLWHLLTQLFLLKGVLTITLLIKSPIINFQKIEIKQLSSHTKCKYLIIIKSF